MQSVFRSVFILFKIIFPSDKSVDMIVIRFQLRYCVDLPAVTRFCFFGVRPKLRMVILIFIVYCIS